MRKPAVILVTGFLGSGKTTLLRQLAQRHPEWRMLFLVNEFSDQNIDELTLETTKTPTHSIVGGSLFCECKAGEFIRTMREEVLASHRQAALDAIIIETSGIADPKAIGELMTQHSLDAHFELRRIVCVVAPRRFLKLLAHLPAMEAQLRCSDLIILNKIDLVSRETLSEVESTLRRDYPTTEICQSTHCRIDFDLDAPPPNLPRHPISTCEANPFSTTEVVWPASASIDAATAYLNNLPENILRVKGRIRTPEGHWQVERTVDSLKIEPIEATRPSTLVLIAHDDHAEALQIAADRIECIHP